MSVEGLGIQLTKLGLQNAFGITGSGPSLRLISTIEESGGRYFAASHEAAAALMAGAATRVSGRPSASISIRGPGLTNMLPGIAFNNFENFPAISISEALGADVPAHKMHKRLSHAPLLAPIVKRMLSIEALDALPTAFDDARAEVPGPLHIELAGGRGPEPIAREMAPTTNALEQVQAAIARSQRPILVVGSLALRRPWAALLANLSIPVFTTAAGKGAIDESLPHAAGVLTGDGQERSPEAQLMPIADLVIGIGLRNTEMLSPKRYAPEVMLVDEVAGPTSDGFAANAIAIGADAALTVLAALASKSWGGDEVAKSRLELRAGGLDATWLPSACFDALNALPWDYAMLLDTGLFCIVGEHLWLAGPRRPYIGASNSRYMGVAVPCSIGVALGQPGVPAICVVGDGGMRTYPAELRLAVSESLPICFLFLTDGRYGSVAYAPQPKQMSTRAVTMPGPSWWRIVEAMGCDARPVHSGEELTTSLQNWTRQGPLFLEATFSPKPYAAMTQGVR